MECAEQKRCQELVNSSSFYRRIYSEVEELGWEHLVRFGEDLRLLTFRVKDKKGRVHILQITLDGTYPNHLPSISADVPYLFNLKWSVNSRLKDVIQQFQKHLEKLQDFWNLMDDIDHSLLVSDLRYPQRALSHRQLNISNECSIILSIDANDPASLPEFSSGEIEGDVEEKLQSMVSQLLLLIVTVLLIFLHLDANAVVLLTQNTALRNFAVFFMHYHRFLWCFMRKNHIVLHLVEEVQLAIHGMFSTFDILNNIQEKRGLVGKDHSLSKGRGGSTGNALKRSIL